MSYRRLAAVVAMVLVTAFTLPLTAQQLPDPAPQTRPATGAIAQGMRDPALRPDASEVAFSYRGDIWTVPIAGGEASRVTDHPACETHPAWHPQSRGRILAFTTDQRGTQDIALCMRDGSNRMLLTAHGCDDARPAFSPDGRWVYFQSRRDSNLDLVYNETLWDVWRLPALGGTASRVTYFRGQAPAVHSGSQRIAFSRYGSGYADGEHDIHIVGARGGVPRTVASGRVDQRYPQFGGDLLYFIQAADGIHHNAPVDNLWACPADGGAAWQITRFREGHIGGLTVDPAGGVAVVERDFDLLRVDLSTGDATPIPVRIPGNPYAAWESAEVAFHRAGTPTEMGLVAVEAREDAPPLARVALVFGDALLETAVDPRAIDPLQMVPVDIPLEAGNVHWPVVSPDGRWLAVCEGGENRMQGGERVSLYDRTGERPRQTLFDDGEFRNLAFSPDGRFVAACDFTMSREEGPSGRIREFDRETGESRDLVAIAEGSFPLYPQYAPDGKGMYYVVSRPVRRGYASTIMFLDRETGNSQTIRTLAGVCRHLALSPDGATLAFGSAGREGVRLEVLATGPQAGEASTVRVDGSLEYPVWVSSDRLVALRQSRRGEFSLALIEVREDGFTVEHLPLDTTMSAARTDLHTMVFDRMWRLFQDGFYDPRMHGVDWEARRDRYRPLASQCSTPRELYELMDRLIGEMDASHVHVEMPPPARPRTGMPGWDVVPLSTGHLLVRDVIPHSPAAEAGIQRGDRIVEINRMVLGPHTSADQLLTGPADPNGGPDTQSLLETQGEVPREPWDESWVCKLKVHNRDGEDRVVECGLLTRSQVRQLRYDNQREARRQLVRERSGGRLVYHHVRTMLLYDLRDLQRHLGEYREQGEAMVLDIRDGVGGNIHHALSYTLDRTALERQRRNPAMYTRGRGPGSRADDATGMMGMWNRMLRDGESWDRPSIVVMNNIGRSDKEIFPHLYRHLGLGTLVGEPSARGVIASGYVTLPDGGSAMISNSVYYTAEGECMEGTGVAPDVRVEETLADLYAGRDRQLEVAVDHLLAQLDGHLPFPERCDASDLPDPDNPVIPRALGE